MTGFVTGLDGCALSATAQRVRRASGRGYPRQIPDGHARVDLARPSGHGRSQRILRVSGLTLLFTTNIPSTPLQSAMLQCPLPATSDQSMSRFKFSAKKHVPLLLMSCLLAYGLYRVFMMQRFVEHPDFDQPLPSDLTNRLVLTDSAHYRHDLAELIGRFVTIDQSSLIEHSGSLIDSKAKIIVTPINEEPIYRSKITSNVAFEIKGSVLASVSLSEDSSSITEVTISDIKMAKVDENDIEWDDVDDHLQRTPPDELKKQCLVKSAILTKLTQEKFYAHRENGQVGGAGFSYQGTAYSSPHEKSNNHIYSIKCVGLDLLKRRAIPRRFSELSESERRAQRIAILRTGGFNLAEDGLLSGIAFGTTFHWESGQ